MRFLLVLPLVGLWGSMAAQRVDESVIGSAGEVYSGTQADIQWTIGEPMIETAANETTLTQGFHQPWQVAPVVGDGMIVPTDPPTYELTIFPNPTQSVVHITQPEDQRITVDLVTEWGQRLRRYPLDKAFSTLDLSHLPQATFFLRVYDAEGKLVKTFKLVKK